MDFKETTLIARNVGGYLRRFRPSDEVLMWGLFVCFVLVVLSHTEVAFIFIAALCGGGWVSSQVTGREHVFGSRHLFPLNLPDLLGRFKEKRRHAGLSVLPNFEADLARYSVNRHKHDKFRLSPKSAKKLQPQNAADKFKGGRKSSESDRPRAVDFPSITLPDTIDEELQHLVKSVMHDFVLSWYNVYVSDHEQVSEELLEHLLSTSQNLCIRLESINVRNLLLAILAELRTHIHRFQRARSSLRKLRSGRTIDSSSLVATYETFSLMHPAIQDATTETDYLRSVVRVLLHSAVPRTVTECQATTAILVEILTCNLLIPLLNLLADPDFIYRLILLIIPSALVLMDSIEPAEGDSTDIPKPKKSCQESVLEHKNTDTSNKSHSNQFPTGPLYDDFPSSEDNVHSQLQSRPKSKTFHAISELRNEPMDQFSRYPSFQPSTGVKSFQPKSKEHRMVKVPSEGCILSSRNPISRSVDSLVAPSLPAITDGGEPLQNLLSPSCVTTYSGGHRRSASDSSFNPALDSFIPGDANPVEVPSTKPRMPRPPTEGAECSHDHQGQVPVIPLTALEPVLTTASEAGNDDARARSSSGESFTSIHYETSEMNTPFTDIDNQFSFEGGSEAHQAATVTVVHELQVEGTSEEENWSDKNRGRNAGHAKTSEAGTNNEVVGLKPNQASDVEGTLRLMENAVNKTLPKSDYTSFTSGMIVEPVGQVTPVVQTPNSSPIKKLLRRVSLKKSLPGPPRLTRANSDTTDPPRSTANQQSAPVPIPSSIQVSRKVDALSSTTNNLSPPALPHVNPTISITDETPVPTAENPRIISNSAPDIPSESESTHMMDFDAGLVQPKIINLIVPKAEVCKEFGGKGEFFLYSIQFDILPTSSPPAGSPEGCDSRAARKTTKRRHREFVNLHSRLEHNPQLKHLLKRIRDVPKRLSIPLAPTAKTAIAQRRISHQRYLQQLLARPLLHYSAELSEFLGLEGDTGIEYVRHQPREYVPRIDKLLRDRVSGLVDTFKNVKSAIPRALSDLGPLPPMSPPTSPIQKKFRSAQDGRKKTLSPPGSPRPGSPTFIEEQDLETSRRTFAFDKRPKTTVQLAMDFIIEDSSGKPVANFTPPAHPTTATTSNNRCLLGPRSEGDGCESPDAGMSEARSEKKDTNPILRLEEVALLDSVLCLLGEALHDKDLWFLDGGFQSTVLKVVGELLDGWIERQAELLLSEHWCAFFLAELRELLWPDGKLLSGSAEAKARTDEEKASTKKAALTALVDLMPESFYKMVDKKDWQDGLELLLDAVGDPQLNRHLVFTMLDILMDALVAEIKDENFQRDLLSRI